MEEHNVCETTSRSAAAISLTFIVLVTPWAIQQVITSCTGTNVSKLFISISNNYNRGNMVVKNNTYNILLMQFKAPPFVDFMVSWISSTYRVWSPVIFWSLNPKFRKALYKTFTKQVNIYFSTKLNPIIENSSFLSIYS